MYEIDKLTKTILMGPFSISNSHNCKHNEWISIGNSCGGVVMENLEACMPEGIATSSHACRDCWVRWFQGYVVVFEGNSLGLR